jgi:hypothetical protein
MNTNFEYLYLDASNYKQFHFVIVKGVITPQQISDYLINKLFFIASKIGLPDLQPEPLTPDDHDWHEIEGLSQTEQSPILPITARQLLRAFRKSSSNNWDFTDVITEKWFI